MEILHKEMLSNYYGWLPSQIDKEDPLEIAKYIEINKGRAEKTSFDSWRTKNRMRKNA